MFYKQQSSIYSCNSEYYSLLQDVNITYTFQYLYTYIIYNK